MIAISRPIEGVSVNGNEYLLDKNNEVMQFADIQVAKDFLRSNGIDLTDEEMDDTFNFDEI